MKKNKALWIFFIVLFLMIAVSAGLIITNQMMQKRESQDSEIVTTSTGTSIGIEENTDITVGQVAGDTWNAETAYTGGNEVVYNGKRFRAKWWTQGEAPDVNNASGPWECIGDAQPETTQSVDTNTTLPEVGEPVVGNTGFKVVGYYPSWQPDKIDRVQFDVLTHINYAFAIPTAEGGVRPLENGQTAKKLIELAHQYNVKVLIAVGGWSYNDVPLEATFMDATSSDEKIKKFADAIIALMNEYGFDGVDMDWEHPRVDGDSSVRYTKLMTLLSAELKKQGKLLTAAVLSGVTADGNVYYDAAAHKDEVIQCVDWFNVMAYDGGDGERHSSYDFAVNCGNYWKNTRKMPAEKVVLGVPFYARPSWAAYDDILKADSSADSKDVAVYQGMEAHYNGVPTIQKKTQWALENAGGVMIWEVTQDTAERNKSLLSAIGKTIANHNR